MAGETIVIDREIKFDIDPEFDPPDLRPVVGHTFRLPEQQIRTTYFDTPGMRLWEQGITFRHRRTLAEGDLPGDDGSGTWILVLGASGRGEPAELSWPGAVEAFPDQAVRMVAGVVRRQPLKEVVTLSTARRRLLLQEPDLDRPWAEIDDDLVTVTAGPEPGRRFRQMELELSAGARAFQVATEAVMAELRSAGAAPSDRSKLEVALDLSVHGHGVTPPSRGIVEGVVENGLRSMLEHDPHLRLPGELGPAAESVHQARVATRRLRSQLRALGPVLDPVWAGHVADDLGWVADALGAVRDLDVIAERVARQTGPEQQEAVEPLLHLAGAERRVAARELDEVLADRRYIDLLDRLHAATELAPVSGESGRRADMLKELVAEQYQQLEERAAGLDAHPDVRSLHRVRIAAKRVRYTAELAEPVIGKPARRTARRAKALQSVLGDVVDAAMTARWLVQQASHPSITPPTAVVAGRLAGQIEQSARHLRSQWRHDLRRLSAKKVAKAWSK